MEYGRIVLQVNSHRLTESDFWYNITLSSWRPRRLSAARCRICSNVHRFPLACQARVTSLARCMRYCSWSIIHSYSFALLHFLIFVCSFEI